MYIYRKGFTLVELMIVVIIFAIVSAIAIPSYQNYMRRLAEDNIKDEMLKLADLLAKHKAKNFTYRCFDLQDYYGGTIDNLTAVSFPRNAMGDQIRYTINLVDNSSDNQVLANASCTAGSTNPPVLGLAQEWSMIVTKNTRNSLVGSQSYNFLLTSQGMRCKNKSNTITRNSCGTGAETW